jgi:hypothetical protein
MLNRCRALTTAGSQPRKPCSTGLETPEVTLRPPLTLNEGVAQPYMLTIAARIRSIGNHKRGRRARVQEI